MKTVELSREHQALSGLCEEVAGSRKPVLVTKNGQPLATLTPCGIVWKTLPVWEARELDEMLNGPLDEEFALPPRDPDGGRDPALLFAGKD